MKTIKKANLIQAINECKTLSEVDNMNLETRINHPCKNTFGLDMNAIDQTHHDELIFIRAIESNWQAIKNTMPIVCIPRCVDDEFIADLYRDFVSTTCPNRFEMSYARIQEAIDMMFLIE